MVLMIASWQYLDGLIPNFSAIAHSCWYSSHVTLAATDTFGTGLCLYFTGSIGIRFPNRSLVYFRLYAIVFLLYEFTHQVVSPSVLPCFGTLLHYILGVALQLVAVDFGMMCLTHHEQVLPHECPVLHLLHGVAVFDWVLVVYDVGSGYDAFLQALFAQSVGAAYLQSPQLLPLARVVDGCLVLRLLNRPTSPRQFSFHSA